MCRCFGQHFLLGGWCSLAAAAPVAANTASLAVLLAAPQHGELFWHQAGHTAVSIQHCRLERHASAHMPELWELMLEGKHADSSGTAAAAGGAACRLQVLLQPALELLQQYIHFPSESAAVLGVNQLHGLLQAAAAELDAAGWDAAFDSLDALCLADPWRPETAATPNGTPGSGAGSNGGSLLAAAAAAETIRRRSRLAVLLQRVLDSLLAQQGQALPGQIQLRLLDLLHRTVLVAAEANGSAARRLAAEHTLVAGAAAAAQARLATGSKWSGGAAWLLAADAIGGAAAAAGGLGPANEPTRSWPATPSPLGAEDVEPVSGGAAVAEWEQLRPALVRQEAEGGCLYIGALQRCIAAAGGSGGGGGGADAAALAAECEARLAAFCLWVVSRAADRVALQGGGSNGGAAAAAGEGSPGAGVADGAVASSPGPVLPGADAAPNPADQPWDDAVRWAGRGAHAGLEAGLAGPRCSSHPSRSPNECVFRKSWPGQPCPAALWPNLLLPPPPPWRRAPLVDAALRAFAGLSSAAWAAQQGAAFPHLARLVCSPSRPLRKSLQALLRRQVPACLAADAPS